MPDPKVNIEVRVDGAQAQDALGKVEAGLKQIRAESGEAAGALNQARKEIVGAGTDGAKAAEKLADAKREVAGVGSEGKKTGEALDQARQGIGGVAVESAAAAAAVGGLRGGLGSLLAAIPGVSGGLGLIASVAGVAAAAFAGAKRSIDEYASAQEGVSKLAAALGQTGQLTKENVEQFQELAGQLQETTAIADDEWIGVLTKLVQFGAKPESIGLHVDAVKNLTGIVGDLGTATTMYAKALQGNYEAFGRYGIQVEEAATQTEKFEQLARQLAERGAGQLEASAQSLTGQFRSLKLATSDVFEAIGRGVAGTGLLQVGLAGLTFVARTVAEALGGPVEAVGGLGNTVREATQANTAYLESLRQVAVASERIKVATENEREAIRQKQQAIDELTDAQMALDLAVVDEQVGSGKLSARQGISRRSSIRRSYAKSKFDREQAADLAEQAILEKEFATQAQLLNTVRSRRREAEKVTPQSSLDRIKADATALRDELHQELYWESTKGRAWRTIHSFFGGDSDPTVEPVQTEWEARSLDLSARMKNLNDNMERAPKAAASRAEEAKKLREEEEIIARRAEEARLRALGSTALTRVAIRSQRFAIDQRRDDVATQGEMASAGRAEAEQMLNGSRASSVGAAQLVGAVNSSAEAMRAAAETQRRAVAAVEQMRAETERRLAVLEAQARNAANK